LLTKLKNLFIAPRVSPEVVSGAHQDSRQGAPRPGAGQGRASVAPTDIDANFYGLVLGVQSTLDCELNNFEKGVLRELDQLLNSDVSHSTLVPRLPAVIPRVMSTLRDRDSSAADLAAQLGRDAVLVSEVVRLSNSPYYRTGQKVTSLERAVFTLGRVGVRQLVANAAFKPLINLNAGYFTRLSGTTLWEHSEKTAIACDWMAKRERVDRFDAYLMAIVQNVGLTVAMQILDRKFDGSLAPRSELFREQLIRKSRILSVMIARQWEFSRPVLDALENLVDAEDAQHLSQLESILFLSDKLAKLHILSAQGRFTGDVQQVIRASHSHLSSYCEACYERLSA
jgi:HD-like signal output (HDOD) protein